MGKIPLGNIKGKDGKEAEIEEVTASVDNTIGEPSVVVTASGTPNKRKFHFSFSGLKGNTGEQGAAAINDEEIPINEQIPTYTEATTLATLTSGEKISVAFGKIKKAITDYISHKADTTQHITAAERTNWNNISNNRRIETGTYTGTGNYGSEHKNTLTFNFNPQLIFVTAQNGAIDLIFIRGCSHGMSICSNNMNGLGEEWSSETHYLPTTWSEKKLTWYSLNNVNYQANTSGLAFSYIAIG